MTVNPGYGGQKFISEVLPKIAQIREFARSRNNEAVDILVDGGIDRETAPLCAAKGANVLIAGTSLYSADDMKGEISFMRGAAEDAIRNVL